MADATATEAPTTDTHDGHQPTVAEYVQIAGVLFVLTAMEFSTYFIEFGPLHIPLLLLLMGIKFALVVGVFMHLKYDTHVYRRLLLTGLIGAVTLYGIAMLTLLEFPAGAGLA